MGEVVVEAVGWVTRFTGGDGGSRAVFREPLVADDTVGAVLHRLCLRLPDLGVALWDKDSDNLGEHIQVLLNNSFRDPGTVLGVGVAPGDTITLLGQFMGG